MVYVALKPKANYYLSDTEKTRIIEEIIAPKAVVAVQTVIRDPEFLYLLISPTVTYDATRTIFTETQLKTGIRNAVLAYKTTNLDKFDSQFVLSKLMMPQTKKMESIAKNTPDKADDIMYNMQEQMVYTMPILTFIIGIGLPSGLAWYWLVSTVITALQYKISNRKQEVKNG